MKSRWKAGRWPVSSRGGSMVRSGTKVVSQLWNQFQIRFIVSREGQSRSPQTTDISTGWLLGFERTTHMGTTASQLARNFAVVSGRRISKKILYSRLAKTVLYTRKQELKTSVVDTTKMGACSFQ
ncbi:hypothetical protein TNCV_4762271 [Trichonephila clavipes]|nr:hypothetical protein TNCV_4762271 [Trichonephila clavipes]